MTLPDAHYMNLALEEARKAAERGEVPIGAVLVHSQTSAVITGGNNTILKSDPTAHAEIEVIRAGCQTSGAQRIPEYDLYVTLEPCAMCAGAISFARIRRLIFGAIDPKGGGVMHGGKFYDQPTCHHKPEIVHLPVDECGQILKDFFLSRRGK
jgi:tRNA(Arg) A34 adenosine deaminase TadA